jgi:hypothetical protein
MVAHQGISATGLGVARILFIAYFTSSDILSRDSSRAVLDHPRRALINGAREIASISSDTEGVAMFLP